MIKYIGEVPGMTSGHWVGVSFDEPVGRSDGYAKGVKIFDCMPKYGGFIRGKNVSVGDYRVRDIMDDDEDDDEDHVHVHNEEDEDEI